MILLNCIYKDSRKSGSKLYFIYTYTHIRISFYSVLSDELKRGNNVSELCALLCLDRASNIVSHTNARIVLPYFGMLNREINFMSLPCVFSTGNAL